MTSEGAVIHNKLLEVKNEQSKAIHEQFKDFIKSSFGNFVQFVFTCI